MELFLDALKDNIKAKQELIDSQADDIVKLQDLLGQACNVLKSLKTKDSRALQGQIVSYLNLRMAYLNKHT